MTAPWIVFDYLGRNDDGGDDGEECFFPSCPKWGFLPRSQTEGIGYALLSTKFALRPSRAVIVFGKAKALRLAMKSLWRSLAGRQTSFSAMVSSFLGGEKCIASTEGLGAHS